MEEILRFEIEIYGCSRMIVDACVREREEAGSQLVQMDNINCDRTNNNNLK